MANDLIDSYVKIIVEDDIHSEFLTIVDCLKHYANTQSETEAFVFVSTDGSRQSVTWSELYNKSKAVAKSFMRLGVRKMEVIAINIRNSPEWLYANFGAIIAGAIPISVSFTYVDGSDLVALMEKLQTCSLLVIDPGLLNVNWDIITRIIDTYGENGTVKSVQIPYLRYLIGFSFDDVDAHVLKFDDLIQDIDSDICLPSLSSKDTVSLFQTSGSTGVPKVVAHTHETFLKGITAKLVEYMDPKYKQFNDRPFAWIAGYPLSIITGQTRVVISGFCKPPDDRVSFMIDLIQRERCSSVFALPPLMHEIIKRQNDLPSDWPVTIIMSGGQPMTKSIVSCVGKCCKCFLCMYGSTEVVCLAKNLVTDPEDFTEYSCGKPIQYPGLEIKIVNDDGKIVPVNERGEIYCRSPVMFKEYFNDPVKTKAFKSDDGWFRTDDIGRLTECGELFVEGRKSNMILSGGFNVAPEILEQVMKNFPGVESIVIVPVPDDIYFQVLCACVVKKAGNDVTEEELRKVCSNYHADKPGLFTVLPKFYLFFEKFPETSTGKLNRRELEKIATQRFKSTL
ncbi:uncharacterized protein LOC132754818 [Ruditapes philippinarum]|uniref:uncharacterized protein LOC132754818 n=1 Tax=Ruditapes philippinarum TaxID=129788 RepID=UPI00295A9F41|nr:uncharacterized protein LOC132754818 [Ruditapes philippinarum]